MHTDLRNANLTDMIELLKNQQSRKLDVVLPATAIRSRRSNIVLSGAELSWGDDNTLIDPNGEYRPTAVFDQGVADKLGIPLAYVRRLRDGGTTTADLYDANVNGLLLGRTRVSNGQHETLREADSRSFMLRLFKGDDGGIGVARALLSDRYNLIENFDVLMAALDGIRATGTEIEVVGADLTDSRMYLRVAAPAIQALAPGLLGNYRSPFTGARGADNPTVFAGFIISNSEVGGGAFSITPRLVFQVCGNGLTITKDAARAVHLGSRKEEGVIRWNEDVQKKTLELITAKTSNAVQEFLSVEYVQRTINEVTALAGKPVETPVETIKVIGKKLSYDKETQEGILSHFIKGGDTTAGGLMNAITSLAQTLPDADRAMELEGTALAALAAV